MLGLLDRATVYTADATTGRYTTVARADLPCRLAYPDVQPGASGLERAEFAALRNLIWEPGYAMPEGARVTIDGLSYNVVPGTLKARRGPTGAVIYRQADAVRAD